MSFVTPKLKVKISPKLSVSRSGAALSSFRSLHCTETVAVIVQRNNPAVRWGVKCDYGGLPAHIRTWRMKRQLCCTFGATFMHWTLEGKNSIDLSAEGSGLCAGQPGLDPTGSSHHFIWWELITTTAKKKKSFATKWKKKCKNADFVG